LRCVFNKLDRLTLNRIGAYHAGQCVGIINSQGHNIQIGPTLVEHIQNQGYDAHYGARPMQETAMNIIGGVVAGEMLRTGGQPVSGVIHHEPRTNRCFLKSNLP
jgi:ATP-dependent Clp protease ATP-binding subunit ClpA